MTFKKKKEPTEENRFHTSTHLRPTMKGINTTRHRTYKYVLALWLFVYTFSTVKCDFIVGKIPPSDLSLDELNGFYRPSEAALLCEEHKQCAGLTYRGLVPTDAITKDNSNSTADTERTYRMYFVRYVPLVEDEAFYSNWASYISKKRFAEYDGVFAGTVVPFRLPESMGNVSTHCWGEDAGCAAVTVDAATGRLKERMTEINLNSFVPSEDRITYFNLRVHHDYVRRNVPPLDMCCPAHSTGRKNLRFWIDKINDTLPRVSCDIEPEEFLRRFVLPREPVMLTGCTDNWPAATKWTMESLLSRYGDNVTWKSDISFTGTETSDIAPDLLSLPDDLTEEEALEFADILMNKPVKSFDDLQLPGSRLSELMSLNASVRIFDRLGNPPRRDNDIPKTQQKPDLYADWEWPRPVPKDLYIPAFGGSDYQWVIMSQPQTGTHVHSDPDLTDAWNALITGHKVQSVPLRLTEQTLPIFFQYWIIFPRDVDVSSYECDLECSENFDGLYTVSWYTHVVPQLRRESWYGERIVETVQKPGETIYVPQGQGHAVLNLDENVSVTENFLSVSALDELAKFYAYGWNPFHYNTEEAATRVWRNLMVRDLKHQPAELRKFARDMVKQVKTVLPPTEEQMAEMSRSDPY